MSEKISVIVPVYKVEPYLRQCVDSIISQTYANLEIILVDDGSPDNCGAICDEYAESDGRVIAVHKKNGGLSDARNAGIDIASGKYLSFIDSDDWIASDTYETLYNDLINNNADISCCGRYNSYVKLDVPHGKGEKFLVLDSEQAIKESFLGSEVSVSAWGKLYKRHIFDNIRYPFGKRAQDAFVIVEVISKAKRIVMNASPKYYYRQRKSSVIHISYSSKNLHPIEAFENNLKIIKEKYYGITDICQMRLIKANMSALSSMVFSKNFRRFPEYKSIVAIIRQNFWFMIKSDCVVRNDKIKLIALKINVLLFKWIYILYFHLEKIKGRTMFE